MPSSSARLSLLLAATAVLTTAAPTRAADPAAADTLFRRGRELAESGAFAQACPLFHESMRLDPAPGTLLNLADCEERLGQLASAWEFFDRLAGEVAPTDERHEIAVARAKALSRRVPRLTIRTPDGWSGPIRVTRDALDVGAPSLGIAIPVDPGRHTVIVYAAGYSDRRIDVALEPGESVEVVAQPGPSRSAQTMRTAGWVTGAMGLASLGVGLAFGVEALGERSTSDAHCSGSTCTTPASLHAYELAREDARIADVTLGVGLVAVAVGTYLVARSASPATRTAIVATPFGVGGTF